MAQDKKLADEWWVMLDEEEFNDDPINLDEVFRIHKTLAGQQVVIVQVSEQEKDDPDFISLIMLDKPKRKPCKKLPVKATCKRPYRKGDRWRSPPTTPDIPPTPAAPDSGGPVSPMAQPPAGMPDGHHRHLVMYHFLHQVQVDHPQRLWTPQRRTCSNLCTDAYPITRTHPAAVPFAKPSTCESAYC